MHNVGWDKDADLNLLKGKKVAVITLLGDCSTMDCGTDAVVGAATADVAAHRCVDVAVGGVGVLRQQCGGTHDLAGVAVAALRDVEVGPCLLHGTADTAGMDCLDGGDAVSVDFGDRGHARTHCHTVKVDGAGAALGNAAAELGAGKLQVVAEYPQQRGFGGCVDTDAFSVDGKAEHRRTSVIEVNDGWGNSTPPVRNGVLFSLDGEI